MSKYVYLPSQLQVEHEGSSLVWTEIDECWSEAREQSNMSLQDVPDLPITTSSLRFFQDDEKFQSEKPYHFSGPLEAHEESRRTNLVLATRENVPIRDIRECVSRPRLHKHGFQFEHFPTRFMDGLHESNVLKSYIEEVAHFVKNMEKAEAVICYDYRVRGALTFGIS